MGVRASTEMKEEWTFKDKVWPPERTVLIRADKGVGSESYSEGASKLLDLDLWTSNVELHELHATHFGIFNPKSGLPDIMNKILEQRDIMKPKANGHWHSTGINGKVNGFAV